MHQARRPWSTRAENGMQRLDTSGAVVAEGLLASRLPVRDLPRICIRSTLVGKKNDLLIYRKRLRHGLDAYVANVPPGVLALPMNSTSAWGDPRNIKAVAGFRTS